MTFSRPSIAGASIQPSTRGGNTPTIRVPDGTQLTKSAPLRLDNNAPNVARYNELARGEEIQNFLNFFTDSEKGLIKFGKDEIVRSAKREVAAAVDQFGPDFLSSSTEKTAEMRDAYINLSARAQEEMIQQRGETAALTYPAILEIEMANPEIQGALTAPGNDPDTIEARSLARSEASKRALDRAGFPNSYQQLQYAKEIGTADGIVASNYYKKRMDRAAQASLMEAVTTSSDDGNTVFNDLEQVNAQDPDGANLGTAAVGVLLGKTLPRMTQYEPERAANGVALTLLKTINMAGDDSQKYSRLSAIEDYVDTFDIILPGQEEEGINLAEVPLTFAGANGRTLKQLLRQRGEPLREYTDEENLASFKLQSEQLYEEYGDAEGYQKSKELLESIPFIRKKTKQQGRAWINERSKFVDPITREQQEQNDLEARVRIQDEGLSEALVDEILSGEYSDSLKQEILKNRNNPNYVDPDMAAATQALKDPTVNDYLEGSFGDVGVPGSGFSSYLTKEETEIIKKARALNDNKPGLYEKRLLATYEQKVRTELAKQYKELKEANPEDPVDIKQLAFNVINQINQEKAETFGGGAVTTPKDRFTGYADNLREGMRASTEENNGQLVITEKMVNPETMKRWKSENEGIDFDSLSENKKRDVLIRGIQRLEKIDEKTQQPRPYTKDEAIEIFDELRKQAETGAKPGQSGGGAKGFTLRTPSVFTGQAERQRRYKQDQQQMKLPIDDNEAPVPPLMRRTLETLESVTPWLQDKLTVPAEQQKGDPPALRQLKQWYNNSSNGGSTPIAILDAFAHLVSGAAPASAGELENASPESLVAIRTAWRDGTQGLETAPLPQVAAATPTRYVPSAITTDKHETFVMIGVAEGTRTAGGGYTKAYYGHRDPADGNSNRGTVSGGRGNNLSPKQVDHKWMRILTSRSQQATPVLRAAGLEPSTAGWNRVMFNVLDLSVQSPAAVPDFLAKLGQVRQQRFTVEAIAKARADSFFNPRTGRLEASGFNNSYQRLFKDQRARAGVFDFRRRL